MRTGWLILATVAFGCTTALPVVAEVLPAVSRQAALVRPVAGSGTPILPVAASSGLSCVPFARLATGIQIQGDAREWWHRAAATHARGGVPESGSVLAFPASGGMTRGHVAVVSQVTGTREIRIDHSNWAPPGTRRGMVARGVRVVDVSDRNDWTAVRVQAGSDPSALGRVYATHGFIYNRAPGEEVLVAAARGRLELAEGGAGISPHAARHMALASLAFGN